ncbi:hypothetical protein EON67_07315 [archaeon]|nr:MAG: hypothetical protein EON67_07315 [archaeon]
MSACRNFDGSSTGQAPGHDSEVLLKPVAMYADPFRGYVQLRGGMCAPPTFGTSQRTRSAGSRGVLLLAAHHTSSCCASASIRLESPWTATRALRRRQRLPKSQRRSRGLV